MTYRNRPYLDFLRDLPCMLRVPGFCTMTQSVACHSNMQRHGRGFSHKSHDCFAVPGCNECHQWLDIGAAARSVKEDIFMKALERLWVYLWEEEKIALKK